MTVSTGLKIFAFVTLLAFASPVHAQEGLSPQAKAQLEAMKAAARPVQVQETTGDAAVPPPPSAPVGKIEAVNEADLEDVDEPALPVAQDSEEIAPLRVSLDKPEIISLDRDAVNVIVGSNENLRVVPDTNKTLVLIAKKPGTTYFRALDADGKVIMQRHVIVGSASKNYIRIRRACANGAQGCKQYSVYYCPDMCHEVNVVQDATGPSAEIPKETPMGPSADKTAQADGSEEPTVTPATPEPPPGE